MAGPCIFADATITPRLPGLNGVNLSKPHLNDLETIFEGG